MWFPGILRHQDGQLGSIIRIQEEAVEPIGYVELCHVHRPLVGVGMSQEPKDAGESATKLHDLGWQLDHSVIVHAKPGMIHNHTWSTFFPFVLHR